MSPERILSINVLVFLMVVICLGIHIISVFGKQHSNGVNIKVNNSFNKKRIRCFFICSASIISLPKMSSICEYAVLIVRRTSVIRIFRLNNSFIRVVNSSFAFSDKVVISMESICRISFFTFFSVVNTRDLKSSIFFINKKMLV